MILKVKHILNFLPVTTAINLALSGVTLFGPTSGPASTASVINHWHCVGDSERLGWRGLFPAGEIDEDEDIDHK